MPEVDYLTKDPIIPNNQNFCCMSLFMNDDKKTIKAIRVSGSFKTIEEAQEQVVLLGNNRGHYNFCAEVGAWNAFDPLPNKGDLNDQLNKMMENYLINIQKKNYEFERRKHNLISNNIRENRAIKEEELNKLLEELKELTIQKEIISKTNTIEKIKETIKSFDEKIKDNEDKEKIFDEKLKNIKLVVDTKEELKQINEDNNKPFIYEGVVKRTTEKVDKQNWYCISFLVEEDKSLVGIKVSGCFDKEDDANDHSKALRDINDSFNVLVGELYNWQPFNPEPDSLEAGESEYADNKLNDTMKKKKENEQKAQMFHEYRKYELINKNLQDSLNNKIIEKEEMAKKIENISNNDMKLSVKQKLLELEQQIDKLENKKKEISEKESELSEKIGLNELQKKLQNNNNTNNLTV
jgi:hypothetical protein